MKFITAQDEQIIMQWAVSQTSPIYLNIANDESRICEKIVLFCEELKSLVPQVQIRKAQDNPFAEPAIIIGCNMNIAYKAIPEGKELPPFLEALSRAADTEASHGKDINTSNRIELPSKLSVFIANKCPHCPFIVSQLISVADQNPPVRLTIVDVFLFENLAKEHDIRSVPTLILDNELRWSGKINMTEVVRQCIHRDPVKLSADSLRQIIEGGEAARVAILMSNYNLIFPAFIDLLVHKRWSVRLGAMVVVEFLAEESPELAAGLFVPLRERFTDLDVSIQGDVVQVMSQLKNKDVKKYLEKIVSGEFDKSVKEAAAEELEYWTY